MKEKVKNKDKKKRNISRMKILDYNNIMRLESERDQGIWEHAKVLIFLVGRCVINVKRIKRNIQKIEQINKLSWKKLIQIYQ